MVRHIIGPPCDVLSASVTEAFLTSLLSLLLRRRNSVVEVPRLGFVNEASRIYTTHSALRRKAPAPPSTSLFNAHGD